MDKRGINIPEVIIAMSVMVFFFVFFAPKLMGDDSLPGKVIEGSEMFLNLGKETIKCDEPNEDRIANIKLIQDFNGMDGWKDIDYKLVARIANHETVLNHCTGPNVRVSSKGIGIANLDPDDCPGFNIALRDDNIKCLFTLLQESHDFVTSANYNTEVDRACNPSEHPERNAHYKSYTNVEDRLVRAYKGLSCEENFCYVERAKGVPCPL